MPATSTLVLAALVGGPMLLAASPEGRAVGYLSREVPQWSVANKCYSCHNNGDAARALYTAKRLGWPIDDKALADTTRWLSKPGGWEKNGGEGEFNDRRRAHLQFAAALSEAKLAGVVREREPLDVAAVRVAEWQDKDGSWKIDTGGSVAEPATHGTALATFLAQRTLFRADERKYGQAIKRAGAWARKTSVKNVLDAAAVLLLLDQADDKDAESQRRHCLELIRQGESKDGGGWGPHVTSPPEVFDTAVVIIALAKQKPSDEQRAMLRRGRQFLIASQQNDGSWKETTRPSGGVSYAQRLSTAGWATLALLAE